MWRAGPRWKLPRKDKKLLKNATGKRSACYMHWRRTPTGDCVPALPFNQANRDAGRPGSKLLFHDIDFNLQRLGGGEPADHWHLPPQLRQQLVAKYHELAGRELRLGRCRRAAYIYAELLGNIDLAASALMTGRHWRDAAVLYRDRLHRPDEAARCLEQGGLWTEAIALYEELGEHEKAGDLYRQLDQPDHARQAYRAAVAKHLAQNDCLAAARVLESKLDAPDEALAQLDAGWPSLSQAGACLQELFRLLARLGRHEAAAAKVEHSGGNPCSRGKRSCSLTFSPKRRPRIPMPRSRPRLPTRPAHWPALGWAGLTGEEKRRLLEAVRRLVPADRLLGRDCQRFLRPRARPVAHPARPATARPGVTPVVSRSIRLKPIRKIELSEGGAVASRRVGRKRLLCGRL